MLSIISTSRTVLGIRKKFSTCVSVPCGPFSILGGPGGTGCDEVRFPLHGGWDSRDVKLVWLAYVIMAKSI